MLALSSPTRLSMSGPVALQGFLLGFSLILAIGAQNAFVLRQGLRGEHVLLVSLTCALSDAILIVAGVAGFGALVAAAPWVDPVFRFAGIAFLVVYGLRALRAAWRGSGEALAASERAAPSWRVALATCLGLTWLNPHVYLDTVVLLGSVATRFEGERAAFAAGAMLASFVFFFALGFGARLAQPLFARPLAWRVLDGVIGCVMLAIAWGLRPLG